MGHGVVYLLSTGSHIRYLLYTTHQVDVSRLAEAERHGESLELSAREVLHLLVHYLLHLQRTHHVRHELGVDVPEMSKVLYE